MPPLDRQRRVRGQARPLAGRDAGRMARVRARLRAARGRDEPGAGHHRRAVGAVARRRREQIAPAVGGADIGGVGLRVRVRRAGAQALVHRAELARRRHLGPRLIRPDQLAPLGGVFRRDQGRQRHIADSRVGVIGLAVGEGEFQRLGQRVDVVGAVVAERPEIGAFEQCQGLQQRRPLAPRAAGEDFEIAEAAPLGRDRPANDNSPGPRPTAARPAP